MTIKQSLRRPHTCVALLSVAAAIYAIATKAQSPAPKTPDIWEQVMRDRKPVATIRQLPSLKPPAPDLIVNESDATNAINIVIQKKSSTFTEEELEKVDSGLHIKEVAARNSENNAARARGWTPAIGTFNEAFDMFFTRVFMSSPNRQATEQLVEHFSRYFPETRFGEHAADQAQRTCNAINRIATIGFHCPAFDIGPGGGEGSAQTLSYRTTFGGKGFATWGIKWELSKPSEAGGYIVQEIDTKVTAEGKTTAIHFWEAWKVPPGATHPALTKDGDHEYNDIFLTDSKTPNARLNEVTTATARFYEGLVLPAAFVVSKTRLDSPWPYSGSLPSTNVDPHLPLDRATAPVRRDWALSF